MKLDDDVNYIASGLERSGTSMLMQILYAGEVPIAFDDTTRPPDESNPRGYFELAGGKIINKPKLFPFCSKCCALYSNNIHWDYLP